MQAGHSVGRWQGLGTKVAITNFFCVLVILGLLVGGVSWGVLRAIRAQTMEEMQHGVSVLRHMVESNDQDLRQRTQLMSNSLASMLAGKLELEGSGSGMRLRLNGEVLQGDLARMERFTQLSGAVATVFMKEGADYVPITTSLKDEKGQTAPGAKLDAKHPAYALLNAGKDYTGVATLFGRSYMAHYQLLRDTAGQVVGATFVGQDFSQLLQKLKAHIRDLKVGKSGYYYVLHNAEKARGVLAVHPALEGKSLIDAKDDAGRYFIRDILDAQTGTVAYPWANPGEKQARTKIAAFDYYAPWDWEIVASAYEEDFIAATRSLLWGVGLMGCLAVLALSGLWLWLVRRMIVNPLNVVGRMARSIAKGDLTVESRHDRRDEIGQLLTAMNETAYGLSDVVRTVQARALAVAQSSAEIARNNSDLAGRTESNASALEQTAAAMEELGGAVSSNAEHAVTANQRTQEAQRVVTESGTAVRQVVETMQGIDASSQKISDIISVIDSIAFQTNILALNAAVEAARAGDNGRGFAVVAAEVRQLASRSAEAAREIKGLISHSVSEIQEGNSRVALAGNTMEQAMEEIHKVSQLIADISHASAEQSNGVRQVADAVTNMDQTTQKNSQLVLHMAGAADGLREQSAELLRAVGAFRIYGSSMSMYEPAAPAREAVAASPVRALAVAESA